MKKGGVGVERPSMFNSAFDLFQLHPAYELDLKALDHAYFRLQSDFHPDRFIGANSEERAKVEEKSSEINRAYEELKDPFKRLKHLILHAGLELPHKEGETLATSQTLLEAMELQEELSILTAPSQIQDFRQKVMLLFQEGIEEFVEGLARKDQNSITHLYPRLSYLWKLQDQARVQARSTLSTIL